MKALDPIVFDAGYCRQELDRFQQLLASRPELSERDDLQPLFESCPHLTASIGSLFPGIGPAGSASSSRCSATSRPTSSSATTTPPPFCAIELEDGGPNSVFQTAGVKATPEWGRRFEHGFSQLVDWFFAWDDHKNSAGFAKHFGHEHVEFFALLLVGRSTDLSPHERTRLKWRSDRVAVNSHKVRCLTFDDLYEGLIKDWRLLAQATGSD